MTEREIIDGIGGGTEAEISAFVLKIEQAGGLKALCAEFGWKPGRNRDYRAAAMAGLREIASLFALVQ